MKKLTLLLMIFIVISSFLRQKKEENKINTLSKNGKSLDNWKLFNGGEVSGWKIMDGILENSGVGSDHDGLTKFRNIKIKVL